VFNEVSLSRAGAILLGATKDSWLRARAVSGKAWSYGLRIESSQPTSCSPHAITTPPRLTLWLLDGRAC
jgi:hypothetical protein